MHRIWYNFQKGKKVKASLLFHEDWRVSGVCLAVASLQCRKAAPDSSGETVVVTCADGIGYSHVPVCVLVKCVSFQKMQILLSL